MQAELDADGLLNALLAANVEFIVIGGLAVVFHGHLRVTVDVDICYARTEKNYSAIANALAPFHPRLRGAPAELPFVLDSQTLKSGLNFTLETDIGAIDLLGEVTGAGMYPQASVDAVAMQFGEHTLRYVGIATLKKMKRGAGRPKDLFDLEALNKISG